MFRFASPWKQETIEWRRIRLQREMSEKSQRFCIQWKQHCT